VAGRQGLPGPISVLGEILRVGQTPPPTVILCAIAEAQAIGRNDLASDIVSVFIAPVVLHHQRARGRGTRPFQAAYERGSCEIVQSPRYAAEAARCAPTTPPPFEAGFPMAWSSPPPVASRAEASPAAPSAAAPFVQPPMSALSSTTSMDDEISALLNADPTRFMEMVSRGTFPSGSPAPQAPLAVPAVPQAADPRMVSIEPSRVPVPEISLPPQEAAVLPEVSDRARAMAPGSPISSVPDAAWRDFVVLLARESPQFSSSRHVGQYRQRRERLAELGIDPDAITGSAQAQRTALDADLADAYQHGVAGDLFAQHLGRPIALPGREGAQTITLAGVLGVIQCAGLEGAAGWLERPNDRKRYPHTTQAFERTNGVF